jgi:hypothetical protein
MPGDAGVKPALDNNSLKIAAGGRFLSLGYPSPYN